MRVAICVDEFPKLSETFVLDHIEVLRRAGVDVRVIANQVSRELSAHREARALLPLVSFTGSSPLRRWGATAARALAALRTFPVTDIIHCHFGPVGLQHVAMRRNGTRLVVSFHGYDLIQFPRRHGHRVYDPLFASADLVLSNTEYGRAALLNLGCPGSKIGILPLGIDLSRFAFRRRVWEGEPLVLVTVARLVEKKGVDVALRAVARLVRKHPQLRYHILGDGPLRDSLEALTVTLGLRDAVVFEGWQSRDQLVRAMDQAHLFILPSVMASDGDVDTQGLVVQEAQAMGLPVIVSRVGGLAEGLADGQSGYAVRPGDPEVLAERIEVLLEHPELWRVRGERGRAFVERRYSMDRFAERLAEMYHALIAETSRT